MIFGEREIDSLHSSLLFAILVIFFFRNATANNFRWKKRCFGCDVGWAEDSMFEDEKQIPLHKHSNFTSNRSKQHQSLLVLAASFCSLVVLLGWLGCGILKKAEDNLQAVMQEMNSFSTWKNRFFCFFGYCRPNSFFGRNSWGFGHCRVSRQLTRVQCKWPPSSWEPMVELPIGITESLLYMGGGHQKKFNPTMGHIPFNKSSQGFWMAASQPWIRCPNPGINVVLCAITNSSFEEW